MRVAVNDQKEASHIIQLEKENVYDFWTTIGIGHHVDIMSSPDNVDRLQSWLEHHNLGWTFIIHDVQSLIDIQNMSAGIKEINNFAHNMDWIEYHPLEDIYAWFDFLETKYEFCEQEIIGESYEGREMRVMKVIKTNNHY